MKWIDYWPGFDLLSFFRFTGLTGEVLVSSWGTVVGLSRRSYRRARLLAVEVLGSMIDYLDEPERVMRDGYWQCRRIRNYWKWKLRDEELDGNRYAGNKVKHDERKFRWLSLWFKKPWAQLQYLIFFDFFFWFYGNHRMREPLISPQAHAKAKTCEFVRLGRCDVVFVVMHVINNLMRWL